MDEKSYKFTVKMPRSKSKEEELKDEKLNKKSNDEKLSDDKLRDEKKRWKSKFEQIQTALSRTEIQMYDYKNKVKELMKENLNLKEHLDRKIRELELNLDCKNIDYSNLIYKYNELKFKLTDSKSIENESSALLIDLNDTNDKKDDKAADDKHIKHLIETNRQLAQLNEQLRRDLKNLETELDESSDKYREDQTNEFKELKFKLETSVKNTRLLQFKLTKLERAYNQAKVENHHLSNKLKKSAELNNLRNRPATPQTEITKTELDKAKEVLLRMHISLQTVKGEKMRLEEQLNLTKSELLTLNLKYQNQMNVQLRTLSPQSSIDKNIEETIKDLEERESDLQEQLKFSEQQSDGLRKKLTAIEQENELLTKQIQALCNSNKNEDNSIENIVVAKVEQDEQLIKLRKELDEQKKQNLESDKRLKELQELIDSKEFIKRGSGELIRKGSGEIIRKDSGTSIDLLKNIDTSLRRNSEDNKSDLIKDEQADADSLKPNQLSVSTTSLNTKVDRVLQKENLKSGSLFYEEKIENLERQLCKIKTDLNEKEQENENLINLIDLKRKDKFGNKRLIRSSSLQD